MKIWKNKKMTKQINFIDTKFDDFRKDCLEFAESASTLPELVDTSPSSVADWLAVLQSRLTLLKKTHKQLNGK